MTADSSGDLEYKHLYSAGAFKNATKFRTVLDEEARAGWELVEKLDDSCARFRRSVEWRKKDRDLTQEPYRSWVGMTDEDRILLLGTAFAIVVLLTIRAVFGC